MAHYRKEIRKVMDGMGFHNTFTVDEAGHGHHHPEHHHHHHRHHHVKVVTIENWVPDSRAYELKKTIERSVDERVVVSFAGPHLGH